MKPHRFALFSLNTLIFTFLLSFPIELQAATITVTNTLDDTTTGNGVSLREAITSINNGANLNGDVVPSGTYGTNDTINFNISGGGVHTIAPTSALPVITVPIRVDGYTQPGAAPNTSPAGNNAVLLIELDGTNAGATVPGLDITGGGSTVRGLVINRFTQYGIILHTGGNNLLEGNFIGTNPAGDTDLGNADFGVIVTSSGNTIGGTDPSARNLISGNDFNGLNLSGATSNNNVVQGNFIGTNAAGTAALGNTRNGVLIDSQANNNLVGGSASGAGNLISGNDSDGIQIQGIGTNSNAVQGNLIGTDATGTQKLGNGFEGMEILDAFNNVVGGPSAAERNIISGNDSGGIQINGNMATGNRIQGNYIGPDLTGTKALGNGSDGMGIGSASNLVGGTSPGEGNVISGNSGGGINLFLGSTNNQVQGNFIGVDATGNNPLGNGTGGIFIFTDNNALGGTVPGAGNIIAFNGSFGIATANNAGPGNAILGNSIFSNGELGIDLMQDGITANDAGDGDTGPNNLQNFPDLTSAISANGSTTIQGTLDSTASANFRIEFFSNDTCDPSGNGEGQTFLGAVDVPNGNFNAVLPVTLSQLTITATATNSATKDTSEFSKCIQATVLVENCTNGIDDDGDNLIDCADPDCAADPTCIQASKVEICDNKVDDDGDGLVDCNDPDCATSPLCALEVSGGGCQLGHGWDFGGSLALLLLPLFSLTAMVLRRRMS